MSWHRYYDCQEAYYNDAPTHASGEADTQEMLEQLNAADAAVEALLGSDAIGDRFKDYSISISGHCNPEHQPRDGYATDNITVSVTQKGRNWPRPANATPPSVAAVSLRDAAAVAYDDRQLTGNTQGARS